MRKTILLINVVRENANSQEQNYDNSCKSYQPPLKSGLHGMMFQSQKEIDCELRYCCMPNQSLKFLRKYFKTRKSRQFMKQNHKDRK